MRPVLPPWRGKEAVDIALRSQSSLTAAAGEEEEPTMRASSQAEKKEAPAV